MGINYDAANTRWSAGVNAEDDLPLALERVVHMHVKDQIGGKGSERYPALGKGDVNLPAVFSIIRRNRFKGPFCLEIEEPSKDPEIRDEVVESRALLLRLLSAG